MNDETKYAKNAGIAARTFVSSDKVEEAEEWVDEVVALALHGSEPSSLTALKDLESLLDYTSEANRELCIKRLNWVRMIKELEQQPANVC